MPEVNRREFLKHLGASVAPMLLSVSPLAAATKLAGGKDEQRKPNIIFILADDLGYGDVGCYGQKMIKTPVLDRMAKEGVKFTDFYSGSTVCAPSRCCLMTGYHTGHARIRGNAKVPLALEDVTVAELLKSAGYTTGIIGKWGLGEEGSVGVPNKQGFDYWFGYLNQAHAHNYYPDYLFRNEERVDIPKGTYSHDLFTQEALDFVNRGKDKPFFLYLAYTIPHANSEMREAGMQVPSDYPYSNEDWPKNQKDHAAMISRMDRDIGRLFAMLDDLGLSDDTLVFFTSDNGTHKEGGAKPEFFDSSGPLRGIKRDLYDGGIRVPMIARWPAKIEQGRVSDQVWAFWDMLPTLAELVGVKSPDGIDGISMLPALEGRNQKKQHEYLYWEFHERGFGQAIRMGKWKAVRTDFSKPIELFDLGADLSEKHDLADKHPDIIKKMAELMETARTPSKHWPGKKK